MNFAQGIRSEGGGAGSVVFAHNTTAGGKTLLSGIVSGGLAITGSRPISAERSRRARENRRRSQPASIWSADVELRNRLPRRHHTSLLHQSPTMALKRHSVLRSRVLPKPLLRRRPQCSGEC